MVEVVDETSMGIVILVQLVQDKPTGLGTNFGRRIRDREELESESTIRAKTR